MKLIDKIRALSRCHRWIIAVLLLAFCLRVIPLLQRGIGWAMNNEADSKGYLQLSSGLQNGCGFARMTDLGCSAPEILRTPAYPVFLATFRNVRIALVVQALMGVLICGLVSWPLYKVWGRRAGLICAVLVATDPTSIIWTSQIMSETLFVCATTASVISMFYVFSEQCRAVKEAGWIFSSSVLLSLAILVKPIAIMLVPTMALAVLMLTQFPAGKRAMMAALVVAVPSVTVAAWVQRNSSAAGVATFSAITAKNLCYYRAEGILERVDHLRRKDAVALLSTRINMPKGFSIDSQGHIQRQSAEAISAMTRIGRDIILRHPLSFARMTAADSVYLMLTPGLTDIQLFFGYGPGYEQSPDAVQDKLHALRASPKVILAVVGWQFMTMLLTYLGVGLLLLRCFHLRWRQAVSWIFVFAVALTLLLASAGPEGGARLRVPAVPFLAMMAGLGIGSNRVGILSKSKHHFAFKGGA